MVRLAAVFAPYSFTDGGGVLDKRSIPIVIAGCILALGGLAAYFLLPAAPPEAVPSRLLMENPGGRVIFTHKAHATVGGAYGDIDCQVCHHELKVADAAGKSPEAVGVMDCAACHGTADDPSFASSHQELYRAKGGDAACVRCHHAAMEGLAEAWKHEDHAETYAGGDCQSCHHESRFEYKPGRFMNMQPQKCSNCHTAKANPMTGTVLKEAAHTRCASCHEDLFAAGAKGCATCHSWKSTAAELQAGSFDGLYSSCAACHKPIPGSMDAFHGNCMGCHDKSGKGPGKAAPCTQCHTP